MRVVAEIFSQGEEVVCGQIVDSNAAWLSEQLNDMGFAVKRHTAVGDDLDDLVKLIGEISDRADCCICTGGLGPTVDDLTTEAASVAAGRRLRFDPEAMRQVEAYFARRQRDMPDSNRKQAYFPETAQRIDNPIGSAPGFVLRLRRCCFVFLPGVPSEMKAMFPDVRLRLLDRFELTPDSLVMLRSQGIGESAIQQSLSDLNLPAGVRLGFRASPEEVQTKLVFPAEFSVDQKRRLAHRVADKIGDYVFAVDGLGEQPGGDLVTVVDRLMAAADYRLAVLETASGGLLAAKCRGRDWLVMARIARHTAEATASLNLAQNLAGPAVDSDSGETARRLADQIKRQRHTQLALVQLFEGSEDDYRHQDRSILLYNGLMTDGGYYQSRHRLSGPAQTKQNQAALLSLDLLRRYLQNKCH